MLLKNNSKSNQKLGATCLALPEQETYSYEDKGHAVI